MPRRSAAAVAETRRAVTSVAVDQASVEGLEGLTIGALAEEAGIRKSTLFSLIGSKQDLQLATLQAGIRLFVEEVWEPVAAMKPGRERLLALCDRWISFFEREILPGGCFFTTMIVEYDAREGPVHDAVRESADLWSDLLEREIAVAVEAGELPAGTDPADAAFELNALASAASCGFHLSRNRAVLARARRCMRRVLADGGA